jgi:hypothetical protein
MFMTTSVVNQPTSPNFPFWTSGSCSVYPSRLPLILAILAGLRLYSPERTPHSTAANAEESAAAAEELHAQSATLKRIVERLTAMVGGGRRRP